MGLWSESTMGSIAALVRYVKSFWDMKKWSNLEYLLCAEKKVKPFTVGCRVRHAS